MSAAERDALRREWAALRRRVTQLQLEDSTAWEAARFNHWLLPPLPSPEIGQIQRRIQGIREALQP